MHDFHSGCYLVSTRAGRSAATARWLAGDFPSPVPVGASALAHQGCGSPLDSPAPRVDSGHAQVAARGAYRAQPGLFHGHIDVLKDFPRSDAAAPIRGLNQVVTFPPGVLPAQHVYEDEWGIELSGSDQKPRAIYSPFASLAHGSSSFWGRDDCRFAKGRSQSPIFGCATRRSGQGRRVLRLETGSRVSVNVRGPTSAVNSPSLVQLPKTGADFPKRRWIKQDFIGLREIALAWQVAGRRDCHTGPPDPRKHNFHRPITKNAIFLPVSPCPVSVPKSLLYPSLSRSGACSMREAAHHGKHEGAEACDRAGLRSPGRSTKSRRRNRQARRKPVQLKSAGCWPALPGFRFLRYILPSSPKRRLDA